jgi:hypothetical protein
MCSRCGEDKQSVQYNRNGTVPGTTVKKYDAICSDCTRAIDNTTMPDREPGSDDDLETPPTTW